MRLLSALLPLLLVFTASAADAPLRAKDKFHLYLLIGQSNMAGRGELTDANRLPTDRVLKFTKENTWAEAVEPLHFDKPTVVGAGIGMSFARAMADADPSVTIGLIPCAVGGTPLERWMKGGDLHEQAMVRAKLALKDGTLKGILWHQGENDSQAEDTASSYGERLAKMITSFREELGEVPFVAGRLGPFLAPTTKEGKPTYWKRVDEQIAALPQKVKNTAVADSEGLKAKADQVHFDTASLREFGRRYAAAMKKLQGGSQR